MVLGLPHRGIVVLSGFLLASAVFASLLSSPGTASSGPFLYSTYHGGAVEDVVEAIAVDGQGSAYLTGWTSSTDLPTTPGAFDASANGGDDAFVAKLSPDGGQMLYSTYLGGSGLDHATGIAVDAAGNAYVTGYTTSADFPTTVGALSRSLGGGWSAFITKLGPSGGALEYSTFLGGNGTTYGESLAIDGSGNAYVTGITLATDFPVTPGAFQGTADRNLGAAFVAKLTPSGGALGYATYLGGAGEDWGDSIAVDATGRAFVAGHTTATDFPVTPGAFDTTYNDNGNFGDVFVAKFTASGDGLVYSTFLGGSQGETSVRVAVDPVGNAYLAGTTDSSDFPVTPGAHDTTYGGGIDAFVTKLNPSGSSLVYSTYFGGSRQDFGTGIAADPLGNAYVAGHTASTDFPTTRNAFDLNNTVNDTFVTKFDATGGVVFSTFIGGSDADHAHAIAIDAASRVFVAGTTWSSDFPVTPGAYDTSYAGGSWNGGDGFVVHFEVPSEQVGPPPGGSNPASPFYTQAWFWVAAGGVVVGISALILYLRSRRSGSP